MVEQMRAGKDVLANSRGGVYVCYEVVLAGRVWIDGIATLGARVADDVE